VSSDVVLHGKGGRLHHHPIHPAPPTPQFDQLELASTRIRRRPAGFKLKWPDVQIRITPFQGHVPISPPMSPQSQYMPPAFTPPQYYTPGTPQPNVVHTGEGSSSHASPRPSMVPFSFVPTFTGEASSPHVSSDYIQTFQGQQSSSHAVGGFAQFSSQQFNPFQQLGNLDVFSQHQAEAHEQYQTPPAFTQQVEDDDDDDDDNDNNDVQDANVGEELGKGKRKKWAKRCITGGFFRGGKHRH